MSGIGRKVRWNEWDGEEGEMKWVGEKRRCGEMGENRRFM